MSNRNLQNKSIRTTLLLWLLIPLVALTTLSTILANHMVQVFANSFFDSFLLNSADSIAARVCAGKDGISVASLSPESTVLFSHDGQDRFFYRVLDKQGRRLNGDDIPELPVPSMATWHNFGYTKVHSSLVRFCTVLVETAAGPVFVQVGETLNNRTILLTHVFLSILIPQVGLVCLACLSLWFGVSNGLRPLQSLNVTLRSRIKTNFLPIEIPEVPSELVAVIAALNELFDSLGNQFRLQQEFIANAAHQLRTPVTAVQTYTEHLARLELTASHRAVIDGLSLASNRLTAMVNGLLLLAQIEASPAGATEVTDLTAAVAEASVGLLQRAKDRHVELIFDMPVTSLYVQSNGFQLVQLVSNLLENAIKFTPENGSVWVFVSKDFDGLISLIVEDTGPGIPLEHRESVFQRFFRVPGATDAGSGLGLAIVKEIATTSNAKIQLSERFGGGSSFRVMFNQCVTLSLS